MAEKILVIEDNPANLELICELLSLWEFKVIASVNAVEGIALAEQERPDLIIMDIQLPEMDGITAAQILKKSSITKNMPIIAMTAYAMEQDKQKILKEGFAGYIAKPVNTRTLLPQIKGILKKSNLSG